MTKQETITKFHLYMDDTTELSTQEESDLYDKILRKVYNDRPWEFLRKEWTGTQSITVPYISLPSDFSFLLQNYNYTDDWNQAYGPVVFVGANYTPYKVVSYGDRRRYRNQNGYAYIDIVNNRLYFTTQPASAEAVEFDYSHRPAALTSAESPIFPADYHDIIYHGMCVDDNVIQQSDKAKSYAAENQSMYAGFLASLAYWNSQLIQIN